MTNEPTDKIYKRVTFYWSPEGKRLSSYLNVSVKQAKAAFKRDFKRSYAKYMVGVYWETETLR